MNVFYLFYVVVLFIVIEFFFKLRIRVNIIKVLVDFCFFVDFVIEIRIWMICCFGWSCCVKREKYRG